MMRSLWTAASGMISQQTNVDTISNNIANVNTIGHRWVWVYGILPLHLYSDREI